MFFGDDMIDAEWRRIDGFRYSAVLAPPTSTSHN